MARNLLPTFALTLTALTASLAGAQSARQSTLVLGGDFTDLISLDPGQSYEFSGTLMVDNIYDSLVAFEGSNFKTLRPRLATSWTVSKQGDGSRLTFKLRDAKFSTGRPVTAADVVYSYDRAIQMNSSAAFLFTDVAGMKVGSTKALDAKTVAIDIPASANPNIVLALLTFTIGGVLDSTEVKSHVQANDYGAKWLLDHSAGSGPYMLNRWDRSSQVVLDANPNAFRKNAGITRVILRFMQESSAQQTALNSGDIDVAENFTPDAFNAAAAGGKFKTLKAPTFTMQYLGMNSTKGSPFEDARVRQAVRYAVDQDSIIKNLLGGLGTKMQYIIPGGLAGADTTLPYSLNFAKAKQLMAAAGKADGFSVDFLISTSACSGGVPCADLAAKIQADLAKIGITANIKQLVQAELLKTYRAQKAPMILVSWSPDYPDPAGNASPMADYDAHSLAWRNGWQNEQASKLAQQAATETDQTKRLALYKQLNTLMAQQGPLAILFQPANPIVLSSSVSGYYETAGGDVQFEKVSKK